MADGFWAVVDVNAEPEDLAIARTSSLGPDVNDAPPKRRHRGERCSSLGTRIRVSVNLGDHDPNVDRHVIHPSWLEGVPPPQRPLLLFDGGCPFCRAAARLVVRLDRGERLAMLDRDDDAAAPYVAHIPEEDVQESWQLIEPTGVRLMHGPAGIRLLEYLPATGWLGRALRRLQLTSLFNVVNRVLGRLRKPLGRFFPDQRRPRRWP